MGVAQLFQGYQGDPSYDQVEGISKRAQLVWDPVSLGWVKMTQPGGASVTVNAIITTVTVNATLMTSNAQIGVATASLALGSAITISNFVPALWPTVQTVSGSAITASISWGVPTGQLGVVTASLALGSAITISNFVPALWPTVQTVSGSAITASVSFGVPTGQIGSVSASVTWGVSTGQIGSVTVSTVVGVVTENNLLRGTGFVSIGASFNKTLVMTPSFLRTTGAGAGNVIWSYTVPANKTFYAELAYVQGTAQTPGGTITTVGTWSLQIPSGSDCFVAKEILSSSGVDEPYTIVFSEPIPLAGVATARIIANPSVVTGIDWYAAIIGYIR